MNKRKQILDKFIGQRIKVEVENKPTTEERLSCTQMRIMPDLIAGDYTITPIYFQHLADKLPTRKMKEEYRLTGRLEYGDGWMIITNFGSRRETDSEKLYFMYYENGKNMEKIREYNAKENVDFILWKANKIISGSAFA